MQRIRLGKRLKDERLAAGLTQVDLATEIGVDPATISNWERQEQTRVHRWLREKLKSRFPKLFEGDNALDIDDGDDSEEHAGAA